MAAWGAGAPACVWSARPGGERWPLGLSTRPLSAPCASAGSRFPYELKEQATRVASARCVLLRLLQTCPPCDPSCSPHPAPHRGAGRGHRPVYISHSSKTKQRARNGTWTQSRTFHQQSLCSALVSATYRVLFLFLFFFSLTLYLRGLVFPKYNSGRTTELDVGSTGMFRKYQPNSPLSPHYYVFTYHITNLMGHYLCFLTKQLKCHNIEDRNSM